MFQGTARFLRVAAGASLCLLAAAVSNGQEGRKTIWDGIYSEAQAARGQQVYMESCAQCHKDDLLGEQAAPALVGSDFLNRFVGSSVDDMVQTVKASMPQEAPGSLSADAYVDLIGYLLKVNSGPAGAADLSTDREMLRLIMVTRPR